MTITLTKKDLEKPIFINHTEADDELIKELLQRLIERKCFVERVIITDNYIRITPNP